MPVPMQGTPLNNAQHTHVCRALPGQQKLDIRLDRLDDAYGSPSIEDIEKFSRWVPASHTFQNSLLQACHGTSNPSSQGPFLQCLPCGHITPTLPSHRCQPQLHRNPGLVCATQLLERSALRCVCCGMLQPHIPCALGQCLQHAVPGAGGGTGHRSSGAGGPRGARCAGARLHASGCQARGTQRHYSMAQYE